MGGALFASTVFPVVFISLCFLLLRSYNIQFYPRPVHDLPPLFICVALRAQSVRCCRVSWLCFRAVPVPMMRVLTALPCQSVNAHFPDSFVDLRDDVFTVDLRKGRHGFRARRRHCVSRTMGLQFGFAPGIYGDLSQQYERRRQGDSYVQR